MKRTKKGITLVELVICCAIIALIGGAATALLMSGEHLFSSSADSASNQMELDVLQSYMMGIIPSAKNIGVIEKDDENNLLIPESGNCIYFDDGALIIRAGSKETEIRSVEEFTYQIVRAGVAPAPTAEAGAEPEPDTTRAQFLYTVKFQNGQTYRGGFVINNLSFPVVSTAIGDDLVDLHDAPLYISSPVEPTEPTT